MSRAARTRTGTTGARSKPVVFRITGALVLVAAVGGQIWQWQPAGRLTRTLLRIVARQCPAATAYARHPTIADGARALDRATLRSLANHVSPRSVARCGG